MIYITIVVVVLACILVLIVKMSARFNGLPILNYHKIGNDGEADFLTVTTAQLHQQFAYLNRQGYHTIFLSELLDYVENKKPLPSKPVMITLDDGYRDNYVDLYPLLQQYNIKANIFLVAGFIQAPDNKHLQPNPMGAFMTVAEAIAMSKDQVQYGLHTFSHQSYTRLSLQQIDADLQQTTTRLQQLGIPLQPCHAFTFGAYGQHDEAHMRSVFQLLQQHGVTLAFRVGNRVDKLPIKNKFFISRIHVSGLFSFLLFKISLWGFIKIFNRLEAIVKKVAS
jgi:peptidoglycan/xylan/chitin deacetylase (PgdA/CDA1 family)